jgi:hypothetical protein
MESDNRHQLPEVERSFEEVEGGFWDQNGFYVTPNGSFWDDQFYYFNRWGWDINGGCYNHDGIYQPNTTTKQWREDLQCYQHELKTVNNEEEMLNLAADEQINELREEYKMYRNFFEPNNENKAPQEGSDESLDDEFLQDYDDYLKMGAKYFPVENEFERMGPVNDENVNNINILMPNDGSAISHQKINYPNQSGFNCTEANTPNV